MSVYPKWFVYAGTNIYETLKYCCLESADSKGIPFVRDGTIRAYAVGATQLASMQENDDSQGWFRLACIPAAVLRARDKGVWPKWFMLANPATSTGSCYYCYSAEDKPALAYAPSGEPYAEKWGSCCLIDMTRDFVQLAGEPEVVKQWAEKQKALSENDPWPHVYYHYTPTYPSHLRVFTGDKDEPLEWRTTDWKHLQPTLEKWYIREGWARMSLEDARKFLALHGVSLPGESVVASEKAPVSWFVWTGNYCNGLKYAYFKDANSSCEAETYDKYGFPMKYPSAITRDSLDNPKWKPVLTPEPLVITAVREEWPRCYMLAEATSPNGIRSIRYCASASTLAQYFQDAWWHSVFNKYDHYEKDPRAVRISLEMASGIARAAGTTLPQQQSESESNKRIALTGVERAKLKRELEFECQNAISDVVDDFFGDGY